VGFWNARERNVDELLVGIEFGDLFVNSRGKPALGEEILRTIGTARNSVIIINPIVSDGRLVNEILAARKRGVRVKLITELRENRKTGIKYPTRGFEVEDKCQLDEHFEAIRRLAISGVHCRGCRYYTHAKVIIADNNQAIISSANGNANSLGWGPQLSFEAGIKFDKQGFVSNFFAIATQLWDLCPFRMQLLENDISLQESAVDKQKNFSYDTMISEQCRLVWSFPPKGKALRDSLVSLVRRAEKKITCIALSFYDTNKVQGLHIALLEALSRGVKVTVIVRREHFEDNNYPDEATKELLENGLRLLGMTGMHAKGMLVDNSYCAIFSGNFNPFSLDSDVDSANVEIGLCDFEKEGLLSSYGKLIALLEDAADFEYR